MATIHFEWKPGYSVNVKILDEQHKKLFETVDNLYQSILGGKGKQNLPEIFKQLNEYVNIHFVTEEKYFKQFGYEESDEHMAIHEKFRKDLSAMEAHADDEDFNAVKLLNFLENWWIDHVLDVDKRYSKNFNDHGLI